MIPGKGHQFKYVAEEDLTKVSTSHDVTDIPLWLLKWAPAETLVELHTARAKRAFCDCADPRHARAACTARPSSDKREGRFLLERRFRHGQDQYFYDEFPPHPQYSNSDITPTVVR